MVAVLPVRIVEIRKCLREVALLAIGLATVSISLRLAAGSNSAPHEVDDGAMKSL